MNKTLAIIKQVDLAKLQAEFQVKSSKVTGLSLNAETDLTVYGADDLTDGDVLAVVSAHVVPVKVNERARLKVDIDAEPQVTPQVKLLLKRIIDLR